MEIKTAIVTGASGFIGKALVAQLLKENVEVYAIGRNFEKLSDLMAEPGLKIVEGNLYETEAFTAQIPSDIDVIFHTAWSGISSKDYKDIHVQSKNIELSIRTMDLALEKKCKKFVFFGSNQEELMVENCLDGVPSYASPYGACKSAAKRICLTMATGKIQFNSVQFTNVFGVGDFSNRTANFFIKQLSHGEPLNLIEGTNLYDWVYVDDAVGGILTVAKSGINNKNYYVGSRSLRTFKKIVEDVRDAISPNGQLHFGVFPDSTYTDYSLIDLDALYRDTGFECTADFKESIQKTAQWLKSIESK